MRKSFPKANFHHKIFAPLAQRTKSSLSGSVGTGTGGHCRQNEQKLGCIKQRDLPLFSRAGSAGWNLHHRWNVRRRLRRAIAMTAFAPGKVHILLRRGAAAIAAILVHRGQGTRAQCARLRRIRPRASTQLIRACRLIRHVARLLLAFGWLTPVGCRALEIPRRDRRCSSSEEVDVDAATDHRQGSFVRSDSRATARPLIASRRLAAPSIDGELRPARKS